MVLLRSKLSGYYFKSSGVWTADQSDAATFADEWLARAFIRRERIEDVRVVEPQPVEELTLAA